MDAGLCSKQGHTRDFKLSRISSFTVTKVLGRAAGTRPGPGYANRLALFVAQQ